MLLTTRANSYAGPHGDMTYCAGCAAGRTRQSNCPGTPEGLISMGDPEMRTADGLPYGDFGECSYREDWGWVVRAMWVTPTADAGR